MIKLQQQYNDFMHQLPRPEKKGQRFGQAFHDFANPKGVDECDPDKIWWDKLYYEPNTSKAISLIQLKIMDTLFPPINPE